MIEAEKYDGWFWWNIGSVKTFFCSTNIFQNWPRLLLERWIWFLLLLNSFINHNIILCWPEGLPYSSELKAFSKEFSQPRRIPAIFSMSQLCLSRLWGLFTFGGVTSGAFWSQRWHLSSRHWGLPTHKKTNKIRKIILFKVMEKILLIKRGPKY